MGIKKISNVEQTSKPESALSRFAPPRTVSKVVSPTKVVTTPTKTIKKSGNIVSDVLQFFNGRMIEL